MGDTLGRYAPGNYTCRCTVCEKEFTGDKRATTCLQCAGRLEREAGIKEGIERNEEEIKVLQDRFRNGIKYDEENNQYILVWTQRELDIAKKDADEISKKIRYLDEV